MIFAGRFNVPAQILQCFGFIKFTRSFLHKGIVFAFPDKSKQSVSKRFTRKIFQGDLYAN